MKDCQFVKELLRILLSLLVIMAFCGVGKASVKEVPPSEQIDLKNTNKPTFQDPIEYVLEKLEQYDLVMIGERHWTHEEPVFIQNLIKHGCKNNVINVVFLEFGKFEDQDKIETFLEATEYNAKPVIEALRNNDALGGWGFQEYLDIFKTVYNENKRRPQSEKIKIILVDGPPSSIKIQHKFYQCFDGSPYSEKEKWQKATWLKEGIAGRDPFMAEVIAIYLFDGNGQKGIYYAGSSHIRKDLRKKDYGLHLFSVGGILTRKYPGRVCSLTFHMERQDWWQNPSDFEFFEQLYEKHTKSFAIDSSDPGINHFKFKSDVFPQGVPITDVFDGYIMLNLDKDYNHCAFIPGFYDDEFAKKVWHDSRKKGLLKRLPPELQKWKQTPWTGEEFMELMKQGLH